MAQCGVHDGQRLSKPQVRDRATLYLEQLEGRAGGFDAITVDAHVSAKNLELALVKYLDGPLDAPFDAVRAPSCTVQGGFEDRSRFLRGVESE